MADDPLAGEALEEVLVAGERVDRLALGFGGGEKGQCVHVRSAVNRPGRAWYSSTNARGATISMT